MSEQPSLNGDNGRGPAGRFAKGNPGGRGNPMARHVNRLRVALLKSVKPADMKAIVAKLVADAKAGSVASAREVIERTLGKPVESDLLERIERLEELLTKEKAR